MNDDDLISFVVEHYLGSRDFNGLPVRTLSREGEHLRTRLINLVELGKIAVNFGDVHPNPHIQAFPPDPVETQITKLRNQTDLNQLCLYPTQQVLQQAVDRNDYAGMPYTLRLALGEPQLSYVSFDLNVLEIYRNDPRYYYECNDIEGNISISDEVHTSESDQVLLQSFGFSYDNNMNRAVTVFLRYLCDLTPAHQQIWNARELHGDYRLHPDYLRHSMGEWGEGVSIFDAFLEELRHINAMSLLMGRAPLFRNDYSRNKPKEFGFLIRPTLHELNSFIHLLDKMISENINRDFFLGDIRFEQETRRKDGKVEVKTKGTIQLLSDWLGAKFRPVDPRPIEEAISTFRDIRKMRQSPAHTVNENVFDQEYFRQQRELIVAAYRAVRTLRLVLANHPSAKNYTISPDLANLKIWDF